MASVNRVTLIGNVGRDAELRYTTNGTAVCTISLATSRNWKDKQSGEKREETEWHRVTFYDRLAEIIGEYARKGKSLYVEGRLKTSKYEKNGQDHYTTEIIAESMQFLGGRDDGEQESRPQREERPRQQPQRQERPRQQPQRQAQKPASGFDDMDDDIPPF